MPYTFTLGMISENPDIEASSLLKQPVTVLIELSEDGPPRYFHGIVSRFAEAGREDKFTHYHAEVVPTLWLLSLQSDCRIFQNKDVKEIVEQVFKDAGLTEYEFELHRTYRKRVYCVQYRETHLNFVSRLLEEEGIFYFFRHSESGHKLIVADERTAVEDCPVKAEYEVALHAAGRAGVRMDEVTEMRRENVVVSTKWVQRDYNYFFPKTTLDKHAGGDKFELFDYPGLYGHGYGDGIKGEVESAGDQYTHNRLDEVESVKDVVYGAGTCRTFVSGAKFKLAGHHRGASNQEYMLVEVRHHARIGGYRSDDEGDFTYHNTFVAIPPSTPYRPPRTAHKPFVHGTQTAVVVGAAGEEIYTDKFGSVKVQFFWDRQGKNDDNSSCWLRVATIWADNRWGGIHIPRIGQEVLVDFLEGDPDRPIVVGCVYNEDNMPPYTLPDNKTQSGVKSRSTKKGGAENFNEIRFEDKKDEEQVYIHAEKNYDTVIENNETRKVGYVKQDKGDQTLEVYNDRTITVEMGNQTLTVKTGNQTVTVKQGDRTVKVETGKETVEIESDQSITINMGNRSVHLKMGNQSTTLDMGNMDTHLKLGNQTTKLDLGASSTEAMQSIELKVGQSSLKVDQMGVTMKGMMVDIEGQIQTQVKGMMTQINGSAMLQAQGGIIMIG